MDSAPLTREEVVEEFKKAFKAAEETIWKGGVTWAVYVWNKAREQFDEQTCTELLVQSGASDKFILDVL